MQPNQWLELVDKHLTAPESVDETELASLRTNYIVWKAALTYFRNEIRNVLILETQKILKGRLLPEEDFAMVKTGLNKPESMTDDEWSQILALRDRTGPRISAICTAESLMDFYKKFDAEFQASTGDLPFEVREALWETRAKRLRDGQQAGQRARFLAVARDRRTRVPSVASRADAEERAHNLQGDVTKLVGTVQDTAKTLRRKVRIDGCIHLTHIFYVLNCQSDVRENYD